LLFCTQALREELVRQRTTMLSNGGGAPADFMNNPEKAMQDAVQMKKMEDQLIRFLYYFNYTSVLDRCIIYTKKNHLAILIHLGQMSNSVHNLCF